MVKANMADEFEKKAELFQEKFEGLLSITLLSI